LLEEISREESVPEEAGKGDRSGYGADGASVVRGDQLDGRCTRRQLKLAHVTWPQMPKLDKYVEGTTNKLCYNYMLGRCTTSYKAGHAPLTNVTKLFANEICNLLKTGVKAPWPEFQALATEHVRQQQEQHNA
jgi:hypothetical protein